MNSKVLIFTKRVLPRSNTFVAAQGNNLPNFKPIYIGLRGNKSGLDLIEGHATSVQANCEPWPVLSRLMLDGFQYLTSSWQKNLQQQHANLIHAHFGKGGYYCSPLANKLDMPLVTTFHGSDITQKDKFSYGQKHRKVTFDNSSKIIAVSKFIQSKLLERGCPENKIIQHYVGIDNQFFQPAAQKTEQPSILFVGRLIEQKGCQYLLEAMKTINQKLPDAQLIVAGYGVYQQKLQAQAQQIKNVKFVGAQNHEQVKALMQQAWVTCVPSIVMARGNEEGLSMVSAESQAVGTPVVAFDTGGVGEIVAHNQTGLLSVEKNVEQLTENLLMLLESNSLRNQMAEAGIKRIEEHFNIRKQCQILEDIYKSVL